MKSYFLTILILSIIVSCKPDKTKQLHGPVPTVISDSNFIYDFFEEQYQGQYIVIGSPLADSVTSTFQSIDFSYKQNDFNFKNNDSVFIANEKTIIKLVHKTFISGSEYHFYPYIIKHNDTVVIYRPEFISGSISVLGSDTLIGTVATAIGMDFTFVIPHDSLQDIRYITYLDRTLRLK